VEKCSAAAEFFYKGFRTGNGALSGLMTALTV